MARKTLRIKGGTPIMVILAACLAFTASCGPGGGGGCPETKVLFMRADVTTKTMPDGQVITMWGYALDSNFGTEDGTVTSPGPELNIRACTENLVIHLDNNLPVPTSIVINGQRTSMSPVRYASGRVRSLTDEASPGNIMPVIYTWTNLKRGSFIYASGTHPAVQVQMGLYGALKAYESNSTAYSEAYQNDLTLLYSEIDPALHDAVANDQFGIGKTMSSTVDYTPKYLLINGEPLTVNGGPLPPEFASRKLLVRFMNAGLKTHAPMLCGTYMKVIAEDGNPYLYPGQRYSLLLPAGKTKDVILTLPPSGAKFIIDRMLHVPENL